MSNSTPSVHIYPWSQFPTPRQINHGTTSIIYQSTLHALPVALKLLKPLSEISDPSTRERATADFDNEIRINSLLRHPNILLFIGCVATPSGQTGLVFQHASSGCLDVSRYGLSKLNLVFSVAVDVALALAYVHALHIMHRDVKPSQIVLSGQKAMLADWGLARHCDDGVATGETGTWEFMAPEVIRHERYDTSADVFSFGMLLHTLLSANPYPYQMLYLTPAQASRAVAAKGLRPPLSSSVPRQLAELIVQCWDADPTARPKMTTVVEVLQGAREKAAGQSSYTSWFW